MPPIGDWFWMTLAVIGAVALVFVLRSRRRSQDTFYQDFAEAEVCEHLRPALELLRQRGHRVVRAGQRHPDLPLEIHLWPDFEPQRIFEELKLTEPVFVSERKALYCKEDWCELHPPKK